LNINIVLISGELSFLRTCENQNASIIAALMIN